MTPLVDCIEREGRALSQRVLDEMYKDAFWSERYGDRGRRHADEDSDFHLKYLSRALDADDAGVMRRYATWLREVLATRGMCSRHLDENFRLLSGQIAQQSWPGRERAIQVLASAREALAYEPGEARDLQSRAGALGDAVAEAFREQASRRWKQRDARGEAGLADDAANYVSYVADALAFGKPDTLVAHTQWLARHVQDHGAGAEDTNAFFQCVRRVLGREGASRAVQFVDAAIPSR